MWGRAWSEAQRRNKTPIVNTGGVDEAQTEQKPVPVTALFKLQRIPGWGLSCTLQLLMALSSQPMYAHPSEETITTYLEVKVTRQKFLFLRIPFPGQTIYQDLTAHSFLLPGSFCQTHRIQNAFTLYRTMQLYSLFFFIFFRERQDRDLDVHQEQPGGQGVDH